MFQIDVISLILYEKMLVVNSQTLELLIFKFYNELVPLDLNKTYKLVTIEFLAVGGDNFTMLGGPREEGTVDSESIANFLINAESQQDFDWSPYDPNLDPYRVVPTAFTSDIQISQLQELVTVAKELLSKTRSFSNEVFQNLEKAISDAEVLIDKAPVEESHYIVVHKSLMDAIDAVKSLDSKPVTPHPNPDDSSKPIDKPQENSDDSTPETGIQNSFPIYPIIVAIVAASGYIVLKKKDKGELKKK